MSFNLSKCEHLIIINKRLPAIPDYYIEGCTINKVDSCKYLGVTITNNLSTSLILRVKLTQSVVLFRGIEGNVHPQ